MSEIEDKWNAKVTFLEGEAASLQRSWDRLPKLFVPAVITPFVGFFWSPLAFVLIFLGWLSLIGISAWIIGVRRAEMRDELSIARRELALLKR